jgi:hypothetical protein
MPDTGSEDRWPDWAKTAQQAGAHSSLSIGLPVHEKVTGALNIYATKPHAFDDDAIALAQTFAGFAAVGLANVHLYETQATLAGHMQKAMESRAVIEHAKGIIMGDRRRTPEEAFTILSKLSQDTNRKLRGVAAALVHRQANAPSRPADPDRGAGPASAAGPGGPIDSNVGGRWRVMSCAPRGTCCQPRCRRHRDREAGSPLGLRCKLRLVSERSPSRRGGSDAPPKCKIDYSAAGDPPVTGIPWLPWVAAQLDSRRRASSSAEPAGAVKAVRVWPGSAGRGMVS